MSVGVQRLRDDAAAIRAGAIAKGEDPSRVDEALALDARRREASGEADNLRAERKQVSERMGVAIKGGAKPDAPDVAEWRGRSTELGTRIADLDTVVNEAQAALEESAAPHPQPARRGCTRR